MAPTDIIKNTLVTEGRAVEALGLPHRVRIPDVAASAPGQRFPTLLMVHGFQGNEDVTWVFARQASADWLIVAPRAPIVAPGGGYSWHEFRDGKSDADSLAVAVAALGRFVAGLTEIYPADLSRLVILGFSQGAGMCYGLAATRPQPSLLGLAALGGYVPAPVQLPDLGGLPVLILHGTKDETIPITRARTDREAVERAGATVTYREDEIGHKVSAEGMRLLREWLSERLR